MGAECKRAPRSAFTANKFIISAAIRLAISVAVIAGFKSQHSQAPQVYQRQMDLLYRIILFASGALPIRRLEVALTDFPSLPWWPCPV